MRKYTVVYLLSFLLMGSCSGSQLGSAQGRPDEPDADLQPEGPEAGTTRERPQVDPEVAQAIRNLDWRSVSCSGRTELDRLLRLGFSPEQGWTCRVTRTAFSDLTGDGIEEAVVSLDFELTAVERQANGTISERRLSSREFAVIALREGQPTLLVHIVSDDGDIAEVEVVESGDLRIELQGCWDCGCDIYEEYWVWNGREFEVDESRSRQLFEVPNCVP